jgi:hypothetical protein
LETVLCRMACGFAVRAETSPINHYRFWFLLAATRTVIIRANIRFPQHLVRRLHAILNGPYAAGG